MESLDILRELVGFPTLSSAPNRALIEAASARLTAAGAQVRLIENEDGTKANLYATLGQDDRPGVLLSGHTDVVPVEGRTGPAIPLRWRSRTAAPTAAVRRI